jgi:hypothetical protein
VSEQSKSYSVTPAQCRVRSGGVGCAASAYIWVSGFTPAQEALGGLSPIRRFVPNGLRLDDDAAQTTSREYSCVVPPAGATTQDDVIAWLVMCFALREYLT